MNPSERSQGKDWPFFGLTMIGTKRMDNIRTLLQMVDQHHIDGDFIECGVWRGGASIYAKRIIDIESKIRRDVWLVDSFSGLPLPRNPSKSKDQDYWNKLSYLKVSLEDVQDNFRGFHALDDQVHFCKGYFVDILPRCHPKRISILRMDGDMYESSMDQLYNLYPLISLGGYIIVDDWSIPVCKAALIQFWSIHGLSPTINNIDDNSMYWMKTQDIFLKWEFYKQLQASTSFSNQTQTQTQTQTQIGIGKGLKFPTYIITTSAEIPRFKSTYKEIKSNLHPSSSIEPILASPHQHSKVCSNKITHLKAWAKFSITNYNWGVFFEDDIMFHSQINSDLVNIIDRLIDEEKPSIIYLGICIEQGTHLTWQTKTLNNLTISRTYGKCIHAYVLRRSSIEELLAWIVGASDDFCTKGFQQDKDNAYLDVLMQQYCYTKQSCLVIGDNLVSPLNSEHHGIVYQDRQRWPSEIGALTI
jgi:hypothetical protein